MPAGANRDRSVVPFDPNRAASPRRHSPVGVSPTAAPPRSRKSVEMPPQRPHPSRSRPKVAQPGQSLSEQHPSRKGSPATKKKLPIAAFIQGMRLVILGVGVWAIAGTALSMWNPSTRPQSTDSAVEETQLGAAQAQGVSPHAANFFASAVEPRREMTELNARMSPLLRDFVDLTPGVFLLDLDTGDYFSLNGEATFSAASMIKVPVLVAFLQEVDAGNVSLDEILTLQQGDLASGSGEMQYAGVGTQYTALETATNMIIISDNTATNMVIRRLGGIEVLNQRFREWGLQQTQIRNLLPDLEGTNTTSPKELSSLLARVSGGDLLSMKSRDRMLDIMRRTVNNSLLPASLGTGATISHKTGDIGSAIGDTGLVDLPNGKRYAITAIVKRPHNDDRAYDLIVQMAAAAYDDLIQPGTSGTVPTAPSANSYPDAPPVDAVAPETAPAAPPPGVTP